MTNASSSQRQNDPQEHSPACTPTPPLAAVKISRRHSDINTRDATNSTSLKSDSEAEDGPAFECTQQAKPSPDTVSTNSKSDSEAEDGPALDLAWRPTPSLDASAPPPRNTHILYGSYTIRSPDENLIVKATQSTIIAVTPHYGTIYVAKSSIFIQANSRGIITNPEDCTIHVNSYSASNIKGPVNCQIYCYGRTNDHVTNPRRCNIYIEGPHTWPSVSESRGRNIFSGPGLRFAEN
ncbi:hypothetical protein BU16DRAFT_256494 [Lophium mytilinum]|uniref:Uncharacterized protein n=1 Tax=Lophium mytilinum TaxID=390894 RepID=A0A6A6R8J9_9PEZI|nr:hypothetical protein BU16DRAFT_256494 [Lophium mytilinum]